MTEPKPTWTGPIPFDQLTKIKGPHYRHIEQLWDEIKKLKERLAELEKNK